MSKAHSEYKHQDPPPGLGALYLALMLVALLPALMFSPHSQAQAEPENPAASLVYIAESANRNLNRRLRELLSESLGASVMIRTFVPGQTSQDSESPIIAIGPAAFSQVRQESRKVPVVGLLIDEADISQGEINTSSNVSAVLSSQPLIRQIAIGKAILPYSSRVAMLAKPESAKLYDPAMEKLERLGLEGRVFLVPSDQQLIPTLIRALDYGDFLLAAPDDTIYNPRTIKHILLTAYRRNRIVIGPRQAYVKAGSLASSFTPLSEVAEMASDYIRHFWRHKEFPDPARPSRFGLEINRQVGRSLNIPLPERQDLIESALERLENTEVPPSE